jgi:hypothetical protein
MKLLKTKQVRKISRNEKNIKDTFNIMNKNRYQVTQDPNETDTDFIKRIQSFETLAFDKNIFKDRAATEGNRKFMNNLKDVIRDDIKISKIVKSFPSAEEVFLINSNWPNISNRLKSVFGVRTTESRLPAAAWQSR